MRVFTIGEVAARAGVRPSALRYYESVGLLPAAARLNGRRQYDAAVLTRLAVISLAQTVGCTLSQIRTLLEGATPEGTPVAEWRVLAEQKLAEVLDYQHRLAEMQQLLEISLRCGCLRLEECASLLAGSRQQGRQ